MVEVPEDVEWDMTETTMDQGSFRPSPPLQELTVQSIPDQVRQKLLHKCTFTPTDLLPSPLLAHLPDHVTKPVKRYTCRLNAHPLDERVLALEDPHVYFLDGSCENVISSTGFIHAFFSDFDADKQAAETLTSVTFTKSKKNKNYKYFGCETVQDLQQSWTKSRDLGIRLHGVIERYLNGDPYTVEPENVQCFQQFLNFYNDKKFITWEVCRTEWAIFDPETRLAGKVDYLGKREDGTYVMLDWKRVENIPDCCFNRFRRPPRPAEKGYGVCSDMDNCKFNTYSLQQNLYKKILEKNYGIRVSKMLLVQCHPSIKDVKQKDGTMMALPVVHLVPNLQGTIAQMMAYRKAMLTNH